MEIVVLYMGIFKLSRIIDECKELEIGRSNGWETCRILVVSPLSVAAGMSVDFSRPQPSNPPIPSTSSGQA